MFAAINQIAGTQPFNDWFAPDTTKRHPLGLIVDAVDPYWGAGRFQYIKSGGTILKGSLVMLDEDTLGTLLPSTTLQGFPFGVAMAPMASGTYGWIQIQGNAVYKTSATVAADAAVAIASAGIVGASATGKQLVNVRNRKAATATTTLTANTTTGSGLIKAAAGYDGLFLGMALSGTGVPASSFVASLNADGVSFMIGSAIGTFDKLCTASGSITLTGTYTGYGLGVINCPFAQGAIT